MERELEMLRALTRPQIYKIRSGGIKRLQASVVLEEGMPIDIAKDIVASKFRQMLKEEIQFDVIDSEGGHRALLGTIGIEAKG